jgi:hypothetical protein
MSKARRSGFDELADRLGAHGCSAEEVDQVAAGQGVELPGSYRAFLVAMGRDAGGLFGGSDVVWHEALDLRKSAIELLRESGNPFSLPPKAAVVWMHQGYQFAFLDGEEGHDPQVQHWAESDQAHWPTVTAPSLLQWLDDQLPVEESPDQRRYREACKALRMLRYDAEPCPACAASLSWHMTTSYTGRPDDGRAAFIAMCPACGSRFWRWADLATTELAEGSPPGADGSPALSWS